ncbi:MAG: fatty acid--CoA ligase [Leptolyngbyaceae cyanobacterium SM1_3_5]|nr:fatty acid--CoA ligase [Leptolyngbyaceae cyanobacterium SM1_3_5]
MIYDDVIQTLADLVTMQAQRYPDRKALIFQGRSLTYQQLDRQSDRLAAALLQKNIQARSRVAVWAKDSLKSYEILFACAKIGAVFVPVNWRLATPEICYILKDAEVELLFVDQPFCTVVESIAPELEQIQSIITLQPSSQNWLNYETLLQENDTALKITIQPEMIAVQMYTSGTTGHPKGVQLAHYSFFAIAKEFAKQNKQWIGWSDQDKSLLTLPIFHIGGLWWAVRGLIAGAENVLLEAFIPADALKAIAHHRITKTCVVPAMIQAMLMEPSCRSTDFSSLDTVVYGGSPIAETLLNQAIELFGCGFFQIYGMTETGNCAITLTATDHAMPHRLKAAGSPFPGVEIAVVNSHSQKVPQGEIGEICIRSPANMIGYWKLPEATAKTLIDGWIHTGDAGYLDEDGYVYICDRIKDMICYASENIYPAEVENVLYQHSAIAEVAVIGVPDSQWGETVKALIVLKPGAEATALDIINFGRGKLANFKLPRSVEFIDLLPRTPSGKVQKGRLREKYWQGYQRQVN